MRTLLLAAVCFILFFSCSKSNDPGSTPLPIHLDTLKSGWTKHNLPEPIGFDVAFSTVAKGYVSIKDKGMYQSIDSGKTWTHIPATDGKNIKTIRFLNTQYGYCIGDYANKTFGYTSDGGDSWNYKSIPGDGWDVQFLSPSSGYIATDNGLYKTTDTGNTWTFLKSGRYSALHFINEQNGWATSFASPFQVFATTDGGATWNVKYDNGSGPFYTIQFINSNTGWAAASSKFAKTTDGGINWQVMNSGYNGFDVEFLTSSLGYKTNGSKISKSIDGGNTWTTEVSLPGHGFHEHIFLDADHGWAIGSTGVLLRYRK